jgi:hypothetical protein
VWTLGVFSLTLNLLTWREWWAPSNTNIGRQDTRHNKHWPGRNTTKRRCPVCSAMGVKRTVMFKSVKCDVAICVDTNCFEDYHTKKQFKRHFRPSSVQTRPQRKKRTRIFTILFRSLSSPLRNKDITAFLRHSEQCLFPSVQNAFYFTNLSCWVLEIFRFFEKRAQNLNAQQNNLANRDIQMGSNTAFKGLIVWRP